MFGEHISNSQILQESERHINIKEFDADFLEIFQNNMEDKNTEYDLDNDNSTFLITESAFNTNLNFGNIVARTQKRNAALNTNKRQNLTNEKKTIVLMAENLGEQIVQDKIEESVPTIIKLREGDHRNHVLRISQETRTLVKDKLIDLTVFFIKEKLNLLRFVRPMNSDIIREVLKCMAQIKCKCINIPLDFKHYKVPGDILLLMIKDEIKNSEVLRFGYQEVNPGNEIFFTVSTNMFKNFDFENTMSQNEQKSTGKNFNFALKASRILDFNTNTRADLITKQKKGNIFSNELKFEYKPYGEFQIVVWMLLQIIITPIENDPKVCGASFAIKCFSENESAYKEIDEKINFIIKEFERKIITRIILMRLNETREWQQDLIVNGVDFNTNFLKASKPNEMKKQASAITQVADKTIAPKVPKKVYKSRLEKWADKMKKSVDVSPKQDEKAVAKEESNKQEDQNIIMKSGDESPDTRKQKENDQKEKLEDIQSSNEIQKYEIKLVSKHRFPSNFNIKSIDNLPILKNCEINEMKNVFVIKNNYKTYIFTLTDVTIDKDKANKTSKHILLAPSESEKKSKNNVVYLKIYGISEPDEAFSKGIIKTIQSQIDQIVLMERAKNIYRNKPSIEDIKFVSDNSSKLVFYFKLPDFVWNFTILVGYLKLSLLDYLIALEQGAEYLKDTFIDNPIAKSGTMAKRFDSISNLVRNTFYIKKQHSVSVIGDRHQAMFEHSENRDNKFLSKSRIFEEGEKEEIEESEGENVPDLKFIPYEDKYLAPKSIEEGIALFTEHYSRNLYTFFYNGFIENAKIMNWKSKTKLTNEKVQMSRYGPALCNIFFNIEFYHDQEFKNKIQSIKEEKREINPLTQLPESPLLAASQSERVNHKGHEVLKKIIADDETMKRLELLRDNTNKTSEFAGDGAIKITRNDNFMFGGDDIEVDVEKRTPSISNKSDKTNKEEAKGFNKVAKGIEHKTLPKQGYAFLEMEYKGELKDERFLCFLFIKIIESIVNMFDEAIYHLKEKLEQQKTICLDYGDELKTIINTIIAENSNKQEKGKCSLARLDELRNMEKVDEPICNNRKAITFKFEAISENSPSKKKYDFADMVIKNSTSEADQIIKQQIESSSTQNNIISNIDFNEINDKDIDLVEEIKIDDKDINLKENDIENENSEPTFSLLQNKQEIKKKEDPCFSPQTEHLNISAFEAYRESQGAYRNTLLLNNKNNIFRSKSNKINLEYPKCTEMLISIYEEINEVANSVSYGVWIKSQFIITIDSPSNKVQKVYHIFRVNSANHISLFIEKNLEEITNDSKIKIKMIFSDSESEFIKEMLKDNVVIEFKKDYYIIDFDKINDLEYTHIHYLKEENFDDLNDHFASNLLMNKQGRSSKENLIHKISSKLTIFSNENELLKHTNYSIVQISLLDSDPLKKIKSRERSSSIQYIEQKFYSNTFYDQKLNKQTISRRNSDAEIILEKDEAYCNLDVNVDIDEDDLIMKQGFSIIVEITMTNANVTLWKVEQDAAYLIEKILNKYLNWYSIDNCYNIFMMLNNQAQPHDLSINESEIETLKESKSKDIRSDIEELGSIQEDNDIEIVFNIFNQDFLYAFKNKLDEENKNTKWNEVSKIKLLKNFSQMIEGAEDSAKNLHAINLISTMQEKHDYSEKELIRNWKNSLGEYITKYNPKFLIDKK